MMWLLLFQIALVFITIHSILNAYQLFRVQNWFDFVYRLSLCAAALTLLFNPIPI
ncbi:hypothetical protein [Laceyella tengchongensis]|nr:hypothetical protein [Laceyella tengchongensis]MRG27847.1 hypothetical protein [Laceyella tengchongensis]